MKYQVNLQSIIGFLWTFTLFFISTSDIVKATEVPRINPGNFGLPGVIDLPTARRYPDGELIVTRQQHKSLARTGRYSPSPQRYCDSRPADIQGFCGSGLFRQLRRASEGQSADGQHCAG